MKFQGFSDMREGKKLTVTKSAFLILILTLSLPVVAKAEVKDSFIEAISFNERLEITVGGNDSKSEDSLNDVVTETEEEKTGVVDGFVGVVLGPVFIGAIKSVNYYQVLKDSGKEERNKKQTSYLLSVKISDLRFGDDSITFFATQDYWDEEKKDVIISDSVDIHTVTKEDLRIYGLSYEAYGLGFAYGAGTLSLEYREESPVSATKLDKVELDVAGQSIYFNTDNDTGWNFSVSIFDFNIKPAFGTYYEFWQEIDSLSISLDYIFSQDFGMGLFGNIHKQMSKEGSYSYENEYIKYGIGMSLGNYGIEISQTETKEKENMVYSGSTYTTYDESKGYEMSVSWNFGEGQNGD